MNFLRFREISIPEIPLAGVVTIDAATPAARDAFRDLLTFGLFGTRADGTAEGVEWIRGSEPYAFVELGFTHEVAGDVTVRRGLAREGPAPVSLHESNEDRLLGRAEEVETRLRELVGEDVAGFVRRCVPVLGGDEPAPAAGAGTADVEKLARERNRLRSRLRRARARWEKLEAGEEVRAEAEATRLQAELLRAAEDATSAPAPAAEEADRAAVRLGEVLRLEARRAVAEERARAVAALATRIASGSRAAEAGCRRLEDEQAATRTRLQRTEEYGVRLRDLRRSILLASEATDSPRDEPGALVSLRPGVAMLVLALVLVAGLLVMNGRFPRDHWLLSVLNPVIALFVLLDVWFAVKVWREVDRQEDTPVAPEPATRVDPVLLIEEIEREFPDVISEFDEGSEERLRTELTELGRALEDARTSRECWLARERVLVTGLKAVPAPFPGPAAIDVPEAPEPGAPPTEEEVKSAIERWSEAAGGRPGAGVDRAAVESTLVALKIRLGEALRVAGDDRTAEDVLRGAGLTAARAPSPTPEERERRIDGFLRALRAEMAGLRVSPTASGDVEKRRVRLEELAPAAKRVREVRERLRRGEAELETVLERLKAARAGAPVTVRGSEKEPFLVNVEGLVPEEGVLAVHRDGAGGFLLRKAKGPDVPVAAEHGLSTLLSILYAIRSEQRRGAGFLVLDSSALPGPLVESKALLGFLGRAAAEIRQVIVLGPEAAWPEGARLRVRPE